MDALRFYGVHDVRCEDVPVPQPGEDEVLVRVLYAGICGSDLHIYNKSMFVQNIPETMGHEFVGSVAKTGAGVTRFQKDDLVIANPMVPCMKCAGCQSGAYNTCENLGFIGEVQPGCFAKYIALRADKLIPVPQTRDVKRIALSEPLAVALNICQRASLQKGDRLAVVGAGPIGLLTVAAAKALYGVGQITVIDLSEHRLKTALAAGATHTAKGFDQADAGFDKIIEAAGVQSTVARSLEHLRPGGTLLIVSIFEQDITLNINLVVAKQLHVLGCNAYTGAQLTQAVEVIAGGKLDPSFLISHEFGLAEGTDAFRLLSSKDKTAGKILFRMD